MTFMARTIATVVLFLIISFCTSSPVEDQSPSSTSLSTSEYVPSPSAASYSTASSPSGTATTSGRRIQGENSNQPGAPSSPPPRSGGRQTGRKKRTLLNREELQDDFKELGIDSTWEPKEIFDKAVHVFAKHHNNRAATRHFNELLFTAGLPEVKISKFRLLRSRERKTDFRHLRKQNKPRRNAEPRPMTEVSEARVASAAKSKGQESRWFKEARDAELEEYKHNLSVAMSQYDSPSEAEASVRLQYSHQHYAALLQRKMKAELQGLSSDAPPLARTQHRDDDLQQLSAPRKKAMVLSSSATAPPAPSETEAPTRHMRAAYPMKFRALQTSSRDAAAPPSDKQGLHGRSRLLAKWITRKPRSVTPSTTLADTAPSSRGTAAPVRPPRSLHSEHFGVSVYKPAVESPKPSTNLQVRPGQFSKKHFRGHHLSGTSSHGARGRSEDGRKPSDALQKSRPAQGERPTVGAKRYRAAEGQTPNSQVSRGQVATITVAGYKRPLPVHAGP